MPKLSRAYLNAHSVAALHPEIAAEWHPTRNGACGPQDVSAGSSLRAWWQCSAGHEWQANVRDRTAKATRCPYCANRKVTSETCLSTTHPDLAAQWHPEKNDGLTPGEVGAGSGRRIWWKCSAGPDHEWQEVVAARTKYKLGCPCCSGRKLSITNSIATVSPRAAALWHPAKNLPDTSETVNAGTERTFHWRCPNGPDHEWTATAKSVARNGSGCPFCAGNATSSTNSLAAIHPDVAAEWHPTKNDNLTPEQVTKASKRTVWWLCHNNPSHEWRATIYNRTISRSGCPDCSRRRASPDYSLAAAHPDVAAEWHPTRNETTPDQVTPGSSQLAWWLCPKTPEHEWQAVINNRTAQGQGCPFCSNKRVSSTNNLGVCFPAIASELHPDKNPAIDPARIYVGSTRKCWWRCSADPTHEWEARVRARTAGAGCPSCRQPSLAVRRPDLAAEWHPHNNGSRTPTDIALTSEEAVWWLCPRGHDHEWLVAPANRAQGSGCPFCAKRRASAAYSLAVVSPTIASEWHPTKNDGLTPTDVTPHSNRRVWWTCTNDKTHEWEAVVNNRVQQGSTGCPRCNRGWTIAVLREFIRSLAPYLGSFSQAELWIIFQQGGALGITGRGKRLVRAILSGRLPDAERERFLAGDDNVVDRLPDAAGDDTEPLTDDSALLGTALSDESPSTQDPGELPRIDIPAALDALTAIAGRGLDPEAVEYLIAYKKQQVWREVYRDEKRALASLSAYRGSGYGDTVRQEFRREYEAARALAVPKGYAFAPKGVLVEPNLMQRLVASRMLVTPRMGNWSGTGAGKTLSAVLASRVTGAAMTVICCPNNVVDGWAKAIVAIYPDSRVATKTFTPRWSKGRGPRYLVVNHEMFQQAGVEASIQAFTDEHKIDFVVVDEIQYAKQRYVDNMSRRRQMVLAMLTLASTAKADLRVLGMSATPVINNLFEGKALIELISGLAHDDLDVRPTVANCMRLHQALTRLGPRWLPEYDLTYEQREVPVDCSAFLDEIRALGDNATPLRVEQILTRARLPAILANIVPGTLVYTHYVDGIVRELRTALEDAGWRVGEFTGEDKSGLQAFLDRDADVLIGSAAVGTGVDGLQHVCSNIVYNTLPWTSAEFEQTKGRVFRQGQVNDRVTVVIPVTSGADDMTGGKQWSWCKYKLDLLGFKKSIADAAVDGVVPAGHLRSPEKVTQDLLRWLQRLSAGGVCDAPRPPIKMVLPEPITVARRRRARFGDLSKMNARWNAAASDATHERLRDDPAEWLHYHDEYRKVRTSWTVVPYEHVIRWAEHRSDLVIGDFGCGEVGRGTIGSSCRTQLRSRRIQRERRGVRHRPRPA